MKKGKQKYLSAYPFFYKFKLKNPYLLFKITAASFAK